VVVASLRWHLTRRQAEQAAMGWIDGPYLFRAALSGDKLNSDTLRTLVKRAAAKAGITNISPHSLRHNAASFLLALKLPLPMVKNILGHGDIATTLKYLHALAESDDDAARVIDTWFEAAATFDKLTSRSG
ncbi:MAG: site-specific integrase, partial [Chloroflexales bacterium]|nr:site-specific integrase [Chloroflexales bacterium]